MQLALNSSRVNQLIFGSLLVLISLTEIPIMQIEKAVITPFHFVMLLFSIPLLLFKPGIINISKYLIWLTIYILCINLLHLGSIRITSVVYTLVFVYEFIVLISLLKFVKLPDLKKIFLLILSIYFINIFFTFFLIKLRLYTPEIGFIFRAYNGERPMGFSSEPSYAAFIVAIAFMCYNELKYATTGKNSLFAMLIFIVTVLLSTSAYGLLYISLSIIFIVGRQMISLPYRYRLVFFGTVSLITGAVIIFLSNSESQPIQRVFDVIGAFVSDKPISEKMEAVGEIDASAWARLGPTWLLFQDNSFSVEMLFGHGSGAASLFFKEQMTGILIDGDSGSLDLGIIPAFIYDFGLIGFILLIIMTVSLLRKNKLFVVFFFLFFFNAGINTQIFWYALAAMAATVYTIAHQQTCKVNKLSII